MIELKKKLEIKIEFGVPAMMQWVKNPTAAAQITVEVQVKGSGIAAAVAQIQSLACELLYGWGKKKRKRKKEKEKKNSKKQNKTKNKLHLGSQARAWIKATCIEDHSTDLLCQRAPSIDINKWD